MSAIGVAISSMNPFRKLLKMAGTTLIDSEKIEWCANVLLLHKIISPFKDSKGRTSSTYKGVPTLVMSKKFSLISSSEVALLLVF